MFVKNLQDCPGFVANDGCRIHELLHPKNDPVSLPYSIAFATLEAGKSSYRHKLEQTEVYYLLSGNGVMHINDESQTVKTGDVILIPGDAIQWLENTGNEKIEFIAIVNPPWTEEGDTRLD